MKRIPLTQGKYAIVDDADFEWLNQYKWYAMKGRNTFTANTKINRHSVSMHRLILGLHLNDGKMSDHINHNELDNRRSNLRLCTNSQNQANQRNIRGGTSKFKGVYWKRPIQKWRAQIEFKSKSIHLGYFNNEIEAAKTYDRKAKELFGEFANTNF